MKIDIHVHTKKVKSGDADTRHIEPIDFCEIIQKTEVKICAITNHNHFDRAQYESIVKLGGHSFQTWPGVELDVLEGERRGHLIIVVNPKFTSGLEDTVQKLLTGSTPDKFALKLDRVTSLFEPLDPVYVAHYLGKAPSISDAGIRTLVAGASEETRVIKEVSNSISAGISVSHGHKSIYGSDVQDWKDYTRDAQHLPELRLPVESFEQFCLLLKKDESTITTILNEKSHEKVKISPFKEDPEPIELEIYNDINVLFGSKGTGKTEILKALSTHYNNAGYKTQVYESSEANLEERYDIRGKTFQLEELGLEIQPRKNEFELIKNSIDCSVTSPKKFYEYHSATVKNKISKRIKIKDCSKLDSEAAAHRVDEISALRNRLAEFQEHTMTSDLFREITGASLFDSLAKILEQVGEKLSAGLESEFVESSSIKLFNHMIDTFVAEISRKTGRPEKPVQTGFREYAKNRIEIEFATERIIDSIQQQHPPKDEFVGDLGGKGKLFCKTEVVFQNGEVTDAAYKSVGAATKNPQKLVAKKLRMILKSVYTPELFKQIEELNGIEGSSRVASVLDLLLFKRCFEVGRRPYKPSTGESAMILLGQELRKSQEIFLIDEPEKSLGNDYINDYIVPLLRGHARSGKRVIVATHDANIAVRTLPYNSIYRTHEIDCYRTYVGNPFSNNLICHSPGVESLDWKETSMRTLEGGRDAFGERGKIYADS